MVTSQRQVLGVLIAAVAAEWARKGTLYPLDTLTTCMQYARKPMLIEPAAGKKSAAEPPLLSQMDQVRQILRHRGGPLSLYKGIGTQLVGVVPTSLVYMPVYEVVNAGVRSVEAAHFAGAGVLPASQLASIATGIASSCVRVPISVVKARLQLGQSPTAAHAISSALAESGWRGLYAGWGATCTLDVLYALVQFTTLEWLRTAGAAIVQRPLTNPENALVGFLVGVITSVLTEPLDVVKTRIIGQKRRPPRRRGGAGRGGDSARGAGRGRQPPLARGIAGPAEPRRGLEPPQDFGYTGLVHGLRQIVATEGLGSLWRGLLPRLLLKSLGSMIWYPVYVRVLRWAS